MIMRVYLLLGLLLLGGTAYFVVVQQPPTFQSVPELSEVTRLQEEGELPSGPLAENEEIEHDIFEVPPKDEEMLEIAMAEMDMGGMDMGAGGAMDMGDSGAMDMTATGEKVLDMDMDGDGVMDMSSADMNTEGMDMGNDGTMDMAEGEKTPGSDGDGAMEVSSTGGMDMGDDGAMDMAEGEKILDAEGDDQMAMTEGGTMGMADGNDEEAEHGEEADEEEVERLMAGQMAGLMIRDDGAFDREISLAMMEWGFSDLEIDAKPGERIKFTLRNEGQVLHEFMFMSMSAMQAVNYRAKRADWNLLEHEALYEKSLLLPGEEVTFVAQVTKPGVWMFMCMLPYHMQMGMMGQMATEGMAMEM